MEIRKVETDQKRYLDLLLLANEQEDMVDRYLERGTMYVLEDGGVKAECVVTDEGNGVLELKNIAVAPAEQGRGYGKATGGLSHPNLQGAVCSAYRWAPETARSTIPFYEACGFCRHHLRQKLFHRPLRPPHLRVRGAAGGYGVSAKKTMKHDM